MLASLRARLLPAPLIPAPLIPASLETITEMETAAQARYEEGEALVHNVFFDGGIYLLGYVAEMLLKTAICRVDASKIPTDSVTSGLSSARDEWKKIFPPSLFPKDKWDGHDLLVLSLVLQNERDVKNVAPLQTNTAVELSNWVDFFYEHWFVSMRYRHREATQAEATNVLNGIDWIRNNYNSLWMP